MYSVKCTSFQEDQIRLNNVTWNIPNFLSLLESKSTRELRTDPVSEKNKEQDIKFRVRLNFVGQDNDIVEIYYLTMTSVFMKTILALGLKRYEERSIVMKEYSTVHGNKWTYLATLFKRDIKSYESRDIHLLQDGSLCLKFTFMVSSDVDINRTNLPEPQLSNDFKQLFESSLYSDATILSVDDKEFKVHKVVLASRSEVFKAMFGHNMIEDQTNTLKTHLDSTVLGEVLMYIYTDRSTLIDSIPSELLAAADYYQLSRLKCLCEEALHRKLTVDNAIEMLEMAEMHSAVGLKQLILDFIKDGQAIYVTKSEGWKNIRSVELMKTIFEYVIAEDLSCLK